MTARLKVPLLACGFDPSRPVVTFPDDPPTKRNLLRRARTISSECYRCGGTGLVPTTRYHVEKCPVCDGLGNDKEDS